MLLCIKYFHENGLVHRDIKPDNFLLRPGVEHNLVLIDFGLSKIDTDETGVLIPEIQKAGFKGTIKYASPFAHRGKDLGRRDDLYSWFYTTVEFMIGSLPWSDLKDSNLVLKLKRKFRQSEYFSKIPSRLTQIFSVIENMKFEDKPNYDYFISELNLMFLEIKQLFPSMNLTQSFYITDFDFETNFATNLDTNVTNPIVSTSEIQINSQDDIKQNGQNVILSSSILSIPYTSQDSSSETIPDSLENDLKQVHQEIPKKNQSQFSTEFFEQIEDRKQPYDWELFTRQQMTMISIFPLKRIEPNETLNPFPIEELVDFDLIRQKRNEEKVLKSSGSNYRTLAQKKSSACYIL